MSTLRGSYCRSQRPVLDHGMLSGPGFFNPFHCLNSRVKFACEMSMCMSTAQACTRSGARFWLLRRSRFTTAPCSFFELCPFRVAGVGHLGHFEVWERRFAWQVQDSARGSHGILGALLKRWQAWVKIILRGRRQAQCLVNMDAL